MSVGCDHPAESRLASHLLTTEPVLMVRADMSAGIGSGHMMRCMALAQAWQSDGGRAVFLSHDTPKPMVEELREQKFPVQSQPHIPGSHDDALTTAEQAAAHGACWTVAIRFITPALLAISNRSRRAAPDY